MRWRMKRVGFFFSSSKNSFFESIKEMLMRLILLGCRIIIDVALGIEIL